ncbi:hypothetical protein QMK19_22980 [Streptomyces sp. H10-C2]|uniref:hypothetical protein n=1 Tax=unclassified Streptomyces TaxID=2593676 RepID=UPI0024B8B41C|nr:MULTISPECIES: hypothetical protein [unclassified Streptomyces]MDJ0342770.1 hypothetical protein [Streptomyces sp. PH10-H1]MDJ0372448.1 hypothetical protein [Streptomyces sp. H10-C2]
MPDHHARQAINLLRDHALDPVGGVFSVEDRWGFFVPSRSQEPPWPAATTYLTEGSFVTVPPAHWQYTDDPNRPGWVRQRPDGGLLTAPLLLHPIVAAISDERLQPSA